MLAADPTERALLAAIAAAPDDESPRFVYADWLLERGDPRGELLLIQLARREDPRWARDRLHRREQRLVARLEAPPRTSALFDRGEAGVELDVLDGLPATGSPPWWRVRAGMRWAPPDVVERAVQRFLAEPGCARLQRLDLSEWRSDSWTRLLGTTARPRHVVVAPSSGTFAEALRDASMFERVERLELRGTMDDAGFATLLAAPWFANLVHLSLSAKGQGDPEWAAGISQRNLSAVSDDGIVALAETWLPRLRSLDLRGHAITARGIAALAASPLALDRLELTVDDLGAGGLAVLEQSRLAGIARPSVGGPWLRSPEPVLALVRSPLWDGTLDLTRVWRYGEAGRYEETDSDALAAVAAMPDARPLRSLAAVRSQGFHDLLWSPLARTLEHVTYPVMPNFAGCPARLVSLRLAHLGGAIDPSRLAIPALADLQRLALTSSFSHQGHALEVLASSALRLVDLEVHGQSTTAATTRLLESPALERVTDLTLALEGNHASKVVTAALLATPYLRDVQRLELDFVAKFPSKQREALAARFGTALDRTGWR